MSFDSTSERRGTCSSAPLRDLQRLKHSRDFNDEEAKRVLALLNAARNDLTLPQLSHFRVVALLVYEDQLGQLHQVIGGNAEPCALSGSICAERAAIVQLRFLPYTRISRLYIVSDATDALSPGMLCREFLSSIAGEDLTICLANASNDVFHTTTLGCLYPYPSIFSHVDRSDVVGMAERLHQQGLEPPSKYSEQAQVTYEAALEACQRDNKDELYPIRYGAAVLFSDGSVEVAWQKKGLEYGTTLDAVTQLAPMIEARTGSDVRVDLVLLLDQFGILHSPSAAARAYLVEYNHLNATILLHDAKHGSLISVTASDLAPRGPDIRFER